MKTKKKHKKTTHTESKDWQNKYLRAVADYQNLERRIESAIGDAQESAKRELLLKFLTAFDDIEKAEIFVKDKGLQMVKKQFNDIFTQAGVEEINVLDKEFDPRVAEAVEVVDGKTDNKVIEVLRKGYKMGNTVIRPATVRVSRKA